MANNNPKWLEDMRSSRTKVVPIKIGSYENLAKASYNDTIKAIYSSPGGRASSISGMKGKANLAYKPTSAGVGGFRLKNVPTLKVATQLARNKTIYETIADIADNTWDQSWEFGKDTLNVALNALGSGRSAIMADHMRIASDYMKPGTDGGVRITVGEQLKTAARDVFKFSGIGTIAGLATGETQKTASTMLGNAKKTLSVHGLTTGEGQVYGKDIMNAEFSDFVKKHPGWAAAMGVGLDLTMDPLMYVGVGEGPASLIQAGKGAKLLLGGKQAEALKVLHKTIYTPTGFKAGLNAIKVDARSRNLAKLVTKPQAKLDTKVRKGKLTTADPAYIAQKARIDALSAKLTANMGEDLKGAALAWKVIRRDIKFGMINTMSRFAKGVSHGGTSLGTAATLNAAYDLHVAEAVDRLLTDSSASVIYNMYKGTTFSYKTAGRTKTIRLPDTDIKDFYTKIVQESAPVARYAEETTKMRKRRLSSINATENRSNEFIAQFSKDASSKLKKGLWDLHMGSVPIVGKYDPAVHGNALKITRAEAYAMGIDDLTKAVKASWKKSHPGKTWKPSDADLIHFVDDDVVQSLESIKVAHNNYYATLAKDTKTAAASLSRPPAIKVSDAASKVSDEAAAARDELVGIHTARVGSDTTEAASALGMTPEQFGKVKSLMSSKSFSDSETNAMGVILADTSLTMDERVAKLLDVPSLTTSEVDKILNKMYGVHIHPDGTVTSSVGKTAEEYVPAIVQAVMQQRWADRMEGTGRAKVSGVSAEVIDGKLKLTQSGGLHESPNYNRDIAGELAIATMDALQEGLRFAAVYDEAWDPVNFTKSFQKAVVEIINGVSADIRNQVLNYMAVVGGIQLPGTFVPRLKMVEDIFKDFESSKVFSKDSRAQIGSKETILAKVIPDWLSGLPKKLFGDDLVGTKAAVEKAAADTTSWKGIKDTDQLEIDALILKLKDDAAGHATVPVPWASDPTQFNDYVNGYSLLDFVIHRAAIKEARTVKVVPKRLNVGRMSALQSFAYSTADLESVEKLIKFANSELSVKKAAYARHKLAEAVLPDLIRLEVDPMLESFKTLGAHARLMYDSTKYGEDSKLAMTGWRTDLLDKMWKKQTFNHNLNRTVQEFIQHRVMVKLTSKEKVLAELDEIFKEHELLKDIIYPVNAKTGQVIQKDTIRRRKATPIKQMLGKKGTANATLDTKFVGEIDSSNLGNPMRTPEVQPGVGSAEAANAAEELKRLSASKEPAVKTPTTVPDEALPTPDKAGDMPYVNLDDSIEYTPEIEASLRALMDKLADLAPSEELGVAVKGLEIHLFSELMEAQVSVLNKLSGADFANPVYFKVAGFPVLPLPNFIGSGNLLAGVVDMRGAQASMHGTLLKRKLNPLNPNYSAGTQKNLMRTRRPSSLLDAGLNALRQAIANASAFERDMVIDSINNVWRNIFASKSPHLAGYSKTKRIRESSKVIWADDATKFTSEAKLYDQPDGFNPILEVERQLDGVAMEAAHSGDGWKDLNNYLQKAYAYTDEQLKLFSTKIDQTMLTPYTREWIVAAGKLLDANGYSHPLAYSKLTTKTNPAKALYAFKDAELKLHAGRMLKSDVFSTFAIKAQDEMVLIHNSKVMGGNSSGFADPLREWVALGTDTKETKRLNALGINVSGIPESHIPLEFRGMYIPKAMEDPINLLFTWTRSAESINEVLDLNKWKQVINGFKANVTVLDFPGYHMTNMISDIFMSMMDGVMNPNTYRDAMKIMTSQDQFAKELAADPDYLKMMDQNIVKQQLTRSLTDPGATPSVSGGRHAETLFLQDGPVELTDYQIHQAFRDLGLNQNAVTGNLGQGVAATRISGPGRAVGASYDKIMKWSNWREDYARMAHFIHAIRDEAPLGGTLEDVMTRAGNRVIKYHFDYSDVSIVEQQRIANWMPFYKWVRNAVPFTLGAMVTKPKWFVVENSINQAMSGVAMQGNYDYDNNMLDLVTPDYIKNTGMMPIGTWTNPTQDSFGLYASFNLPLSSVWKNRIAPVLQPWTDPYNSVKDKAVGSVYGTGYVAGSMLGPNLSIPIQAITGQKVFPSGPKSAPISIDTFAGIIPGGNALNKTRKLIQNTGKEQFQTDNGRAALLADYIGFINTQANTEKAQIGHLMRKKDILSDHRKQWEQKFKDKHLSKVLPPELVDEAMKILEQEARNERKAATGG